jgi:para-aminobenzoate synthetase / 4-amino-4-deoxychorismate lyase
MLVVDGQPIELDAHLERMAASLAALFGSKTPSRAGDLVLDRAKGVSLGRLRLTVAPNVDGGLGAEVATAEVEPALVFPSPERSVALNSHVLDGGLGAHKWVDRRFLEAAEAGAPAGSVALLVDGDGAVLEASRANVFLVLAGTLLTPPIDGRILPGIARRRAIEIAKEEGIAVREEAVALGRLVEADEVFLTGSVRGVEPVASIDGVDIIPGGKVSAQIAAGLKRRWMSASGPRVVPVLNASDFSRPPR